MANMRTFGEADVAPRAGMRGEVGEPGFQFSVTYIYDQNEKEKGREGKWKEIRKSFKTSSGLVAPALVPYLLNKTTLLDANFSQV